MSGKVIFTKYITTSPEFLRNLYKLGVSAREKREAGFHVHLFPDKDFRSSEVYFGGLAHLSQPKGICSAAREALPPSGVAEGKEAAEQRESDFEHLTKVFDVHCHSILKRAGWRNFFSERDFDLMQSGVAIGMVAAPLNPPGMGLLIAQPKVSLFRESQEHITGLYQQALEGMLVWISVFNEKRVKISPWIWKEGAVTALNSAGLAAAAILYHFPPACSEEQFLSENTATEAIKGEGWKARHKRTPGAFNIGQKMETDRLLWWARESSDAQEITPAKLISSLGGICKGHRVLNNRITGISLEEYFYAPEEEYQRIRVLLLEKTLLAPWEAVELSRQLIKALDIDDYLKIKAEDIVDWKIKREDAERIKKMSLFGIMELVVLTEASEGRILRLIKQGEIKPDFTVTSGENTSYFFLEMPAALKGKGK